jgi:hypothetical protein
LDEDCDCAQVFGVDKRVYGPKEAPRFRIKAQTDKMKWMGRLLERNIMVGDTFVAWLQVAMQFDDVAKDG